MPETTKIEHAGPAAPRHTLLFAKHKGLAKEWPFVEHRLLERLAELGDVDVLEISDEDNKSQLSDLTDLSPYIGIVWFGGVLSAKCLFKAKKLRMIGCHQDNTVEQLTLAELESRNLVMIDATRASAQSIAECGMALTLCALRRIPYWHRRMKNKDPLWDFKYTQYCDDSRFVNGDLGTKKVGVIGLGQVGSRMAKWCKAMGSQVFGYDPYIPPSVAQNWGVELASLDKIVDVCRVIVVAVPNAPNAQNLLNAARIDKIKKHSLVVVLTSAYTVDMDALRRRILADELAGAFDVYDREPLPVNDPLRDRHNVIHLPHIGGRTRDSNIRVADIIADDFERILRDEKPSSALNAKDAEIRLGKFQ